MFTYAVCTCMCPMRRRVRVTRLKQDVASVRENVKVDAPKRDSKNFKLHRD